MQINHWLSHKTLLPILIVLVLSGCSKQSPTSLDSTNTSSTSATRIATNKKLTSKSPQVKTPKQLGLYSFPEFELVDAKPTEMEKGITLLNLVHTPMGGKALNTKWLASEYMQSDVSLLVAVNHQGDVIWHYSSDKLYVDVSVADAKKGHLRLVDNLGSALTLDMYGNVVQSWVSDRNRKNIDYFKTKGLKPKHIEADVIHHNWASLDNGNHLLLGLEMRVIEDYPPYPENIHDVMVTEAIPANIRQQLDSRVSTTAQVVGDVIMEINEAGTILSQWSLHDILDSKRLSYDSWSPFYIRNYPPNKLGFSKDWTHATGLIYDKSRDTIIVSLRNQDAIIGITRATGKLKWILGDSTGWQALWSKKLLKPIDQKGDTIDMDWPYHMQSPQLTQSGTLVVFDNGGYRAVPPKEPKSLKQGYSRVVDYKIDEDKMTVEALWRYPHAKASTKESSEQENLFSFWQGSVDTLSKTNNVLLSDGGGVLEVNREGNTVFEINVKGSNTVNPKGWVITQALRVSGLPQGVPKIHSIGSQSKSSPKSLSNAVRSTRLPAVIPEWAKKVTKANFTGQWQLTLETEQGEQVFALALHDDNTQDPERVITGTLGNDSIYAYIKHHQISFKVLNRQGRKPIVLNFRGLLQEDLGTILGRAVIDGANDQDVSLNWTAEQ